MIIKKKLFLACMLSAVLLTAGCGKAENLSSENNAKTTTTVTTKAEPKNDSELTQDEIMKKYGYKGKFDDKIFKKMVNNIYVNDLHLTFPCTFKDLLKLDDTFRIRFNSLCYRCDEKFQGYQIGMVTFEDGSNLVNSDEVDITDKKITQISLDWIGKSTAAKIDKVNLSISLGGIHILDDDITTVKKYLGEPTKKWLHDKDESILGSSYIYTADKVELHIMFDKSDKVIDIRYNLNRGED